MDTHATATSKIKAPDITLPKGGGSIQGIGETFQPNGFSGTGGYTLTIPVTPACGFEPQLSLAYSSGSGNGPFGMGFSLSLPKIAIRTEKGIPRANTIFRNPARAERTSPSCFPKTRGGILFKDN